MNCKCVLFCQQLSKTLCAKALRLTETECVGVRRSAGAEVYRVLTFLQCKTSCGRLALEGKRPLAEISVEISRASNSIYCGHGYMSAD